MRLRARLVRLRLLPQPLRDRQQQRRRQRRRHVIPLRLQRARRLRPQMRPPAAPVAAEMAAPCLCQLCVSGASAARRELTREV